MASDSAALMAGTEPLESEADGTTAGPDGGLADGTNLHPRLTGGYPDNPLHGARSTSVPDMLSG